MTDLIVRGGTVVTAAGSRRADVAVEGARIAAIGPDLGTDAGEVVDATGLLVLPGVVDVHTHTRVATDAEPDRTRLDSVAPPVAARPFWPSTTRAPASRAAGRTPCGPPWWRSLTRAMRPWTSP
jgi:imidazolonepropionase-like amidohydrolase